METYLFKFSACLAIFWLVYVLILERQKMHHIKRFYLLGAFAAALIIPLLTITHYVEPIVTTDFEISPLFIPIEPSFIETPIEEPPFWNLETVLWFVYGLGALLFSLRFIKNLTNMYRRISNNENVVKDSFIYVLLKDYRIPHSFFKYLFFNKSIYESNAIPKEVQLHEETHAKQLHSLDIIIVELLQIVFWFHPLIYMLKHHIKLNHEFLADEAVLSKGIDTKNYQNILLQFSSNAQEHQLSSAINYSSIKKRFTVMKTQTSKTRIWVSSLLLLPIIAILFFIFSTKEYVEKDNSDIVDAIEAELREANALQMEFVDGASYKLMQEYRDFIAKFKDTNIIIGEKYERAKIIYDELMSEIQRNSVDKYPEHRFPLRSLSKVEAKKPTASQFESWKDGDKFAIWVDSKPIKNSELNTYNVNDIVHFTGSKVYENARSAKYPQPFQFNLYTQKGFQKTYKEADLDKYKKAIQNYTNAINKYLEGPQEDNLELQILFVLAHDIYSTFSEEDIEKHSIKFPPGCPPTKKELDIINNTPTLNIKEDGTWWINNKKTSIESIKEDFNALIKTEKSSLNLISEKSISVQEINKIHLAIGENITSISVSPNQTTVYDTVENVNRYQYNNYKELYERYESLRKEQPHYIYKSKEQQKEMDALFSELGGIYFRMSRENKAKVKRPISPIKPYVQITLNGKTYYKKRNELTAEEIATFPPPPAPAIREKATKQQIAEYNTWAKKINTAMAKVKATNDANWHPIVKLKDVNRYKAIYNAMTASQKQNAEVWPSFPPPPEMPNKTKQKGGPNLSSYTKQKPNDSLRYIFTNKDDNRTNIANVNSSLNEEQKKQLSSRMVILRAAESLKKEASYKIEGQSTSLEKVYTFVNSNPEASIKTINNSDGSLTLSFSNRKEEKMSTDELQTVYTEVFNEPNTRSNIPTFVVTPLKSQKAQSNTNPSFLEYIIEMEQKGASFYMEYKKISAEEAKTIAKSNKGKSTQIFTQKDADGKYVVKISENLDNLPSFIKSKIIGFHDNWFITINGKKYYYTFINNTAQYYDENYTKVNLDIVSEYKKKHNKLEALKKIAPHYIYKTNIEQDQMNNLFSDLGGMYFRMSKADKQKIIRPLPPILPYAILIINGKKEYKKISELTEEDKKLLQPPPPPPKSSKN
ncbi:M56 family metallopeptidase [Winogradskyella sp. UBA3174]|uniref:M56 family metallopeptidase n=1 Tax=Winogradskyella sp. UBA3174 TaxID=1947785 RepID=UPI0025D48C7E|nr:M56 family metallopeptidase [Winogradskyella sp. UBA3174]|tara:strand:+ start:61850 stop:65323 length:3474 start_codon:yes stop_codon:yes gene_type:complete